MLKVKYLTLILVCIMSYIYYDSAISQFVKLIPYYSLIFPFFKLNIGHFVIFKSYF
jgi:hypothetical protein